MSPRSKFTAINRIIKFTEKIWHDYIIFLNWIKYLEYFFYFDNRNRHHMIDLQYYAFKWQTISSTIILEISLLITFYLINFIPTYNYDSGVVLDNSDFNIMIWIIALIGLLSVFLSLQPSWIKLCKSLNEKVAKLDRLDSLENNVAEEEDER